MLRRSASRARAVNIKLMAPLLLIAGVLVVLSSVWSPAAKAITSSTNLNFQARLLTNTGAIVPDGTYNVDFKIYNANGTTGTVGTCTGACLWEETRLVASSQGVSLVNGYFSVNLGSVTSFPSTMPWDQQLYLTMNFTTNGTTSCTPATSCTWNGEMQNAGNSIALTAVPLAFMANKLQVNNGTQTGTLKFNTVANSPVITLPDETGTVCTSAASSTANCTNFAPATGGSGYVQLAPASVQVDSSTNNSIFINKTGASGNILNLQKSGSSVLILDNTGNLAVNSTASTGGAALGSTANGSELKLNGSTFHHFSILNASGNLQIGKSDGGVALGQAVTAYLTINGGTGDLTATGKYNTNTFTGSGLQFGSTATLQAAAASALTITGHSTSAWTVDTGNLTLDATAASAQVNLGTGAQAKTVQIGINGTNTGNTQTINIGNQVAAGTTNVVLGAFTGATAGNTTIQAFGTLALQTAASGIINIGNNAVAQTIQIGNSTSGTTVTVDCAANPCNFGTTGVSHTTGLGSSFNTSTTNLNAGTGGLNLGNNGVANTIQIGNLTGAVTQNVNIGTNATASSTNNVTIGSTVAGSITLQSAATIAIGNNAAAQTINIGNATGGTAVSVLCGTGTCGFGNNATDHSTSIGSGTGASQTVINGGTSGILLNDNTTVASNQSFTALGQAVFRDNTNIGAAFQVQNAAAAPILNVDTQTAQGVVSVGAFNAANTSFPTTSVLDTFTGTTGTVPPNGNWSQGPLGFGGAGATASGLKISSNAVTLNTANANFRQDDYWNPTTFGPDSEVYTTVSTVGASDQIGLYLRGTSIGSGTSNGYYLNISFPSSWVIQKMTAGVTSNLSGTLTQTVSSGDLVGFSARGTTIIAWYKAAAGVWTAVGTVTDGTYSSAGNIGIGIAGSAATTVLDNFGGGTSRSGFTVDTSGNVLSKNIADSTTAFQIQNASGQNILATDTSNGKVILGTAGSSGINGQLVFNTTNASNTNITIVAASTGTSYSLTLPTTGPSTSQCLQTDSVTASQLKFGSCSGTAPTLQQVYDASTSQPQIVLDSSPGASGLIIRDNATPLATNVLLSVQNNGGGTKFLDVRNNGFDILGAGASTISTSSGNLTLSTTGATTASIDSGASGTVSLGNTNATTVNLANTQAAAAVSIGAAATTGTFSVGGTATTGTITIGQATSGNNTINIGTGARTSSTQTVIIGGGNSATSGGVVVNIGNGTPGAGTTNQVNIGTGGGTTGTVALIIGSNGAAAHTTLIQGGNGTGTTNAAIKIQPAAAGDVYIGTTAATGTIIIGTSSSANNVLIADGAGASAVHIADAQNGGSVEIGNGFTTGTFSVGGTATTGIITIGRASTATTAGVNILSAAGTASTQTVNIAGGSSTTSGGKVVNIANGAPGTGTTNAVSIGTGGGAGAGTVGITIGSATAAAHTLVLQGGNGTGASAAIKIQANTAGDILIGDPAATGTFTLGSSSGINNINIANGAGASGVAIANVQNGGSVAIGNGFTTGTFSVGGTATTGIITIGQTTTGTTGTVNILSANGTSSTQTITIGGGSSTTAGGKVVNIATGAAGTGTTNTVHIADTAPTGTGTNAVTIGTNSAAANTTTINAGVNGANETLQLQVAASGFIGIGTSAATKTIDIGSVGSTIGASTILIGSTSDATTNQVVTIGSAAANTSDVTTIQGGSGTIAGTGAAIKLQPNAAGDILIGNTSGTGIIAVGSSSSAQTVNIANGAGAPTVNIANASVSGVNISIAGAANTSANSVSILNGASGANATFNLLSGGGTAGAADIHIGNNARVNVIDLGNVANAANRTTTIAGGNTPTGISDTVNIATGNTVGTGTKVVHIADGNPAGTNAVTIGSVTATANTTLIQGGNGAGAISLQTAASSGTILLGTVNNSNISTGTGTFTHNGATTVASNVSFTANGDSVFNDATQKATAFLIQGGGDTLLQANTVTRTSGVAGNLIKVGNSTSSTDVDTTVLQLDGFAGALTTNLASLNGGMYYNSSTGHINVIEGGAVKEVCNKTDTGCGTGGGGSTLAASYNLGTTSTDQTILTQTTKGGAVIIKDNATNTVNGIIFQVQNSSSANLLSANSSTNTITVNTVAANSAATFGAVTAAATTTVDNTATDTGSNESMVLDANGFANISYYDNSATKQLKFAQCTNITCTTSNIATPDTVTVGQYTSVKMGTDGFPRISYYDSGSTQLKFVQCGNAACNSGNTITAVDNTATTTGWNTSLAINPYDGTARISYFDASATNQLKYAQCTNAACSTSVLTVVDSGSGAGQPSSLVLGNDGFGRIAYAKGSTPSLYYAQCTNASCSTKNITSIDNGGGGTVMNASLAIGTDGVPHISYFDFNSPYSLIVATYVGGGGTGCSSTTAWTCVTMATGVSGRVAGSMAVDSNNLPWLTYRDTTNGLKLIQCLSSTCSANQTFTIDSGSGAGNSLVLPTPIAPIAIASDGLPRIAYYDSTSTALKFAQVTSTAAGGLSAGIDIGASASNFGNVYVGNINTDYYNQKPSVDSTMAFQIQTSAGSTLLSANTVAGVLGFANSIPLSISVGTQSLGAQTVVQIPGLSITSGTVSPYFAAATGTDGYPKIATVISSKLNYIQCTSYTCAGNTVSVADASSVIAGASGNEQIGLAIDSSGFGRMSDFDTTASTLRYTQCTNAACSTSASTPLDNTGDATGIESSIAVNSAGLASISYLDSTTSQVKILSCGVAACTSGNTIQVLATIATLAPTKIAIGPDGFARVLYQASGGQWTFVQCTIANCTTFNTQALGISDSSFWGSIAFGPDGLPRLLIDNVSGLTFVQCTTVSCSSKNTSVFGTSGTGSSADMSIGPDGYARFLWVVSNTQYNYITCTNASCSTYLTSATITPSASANPHMSLSNIGTPFVTYQSSTSATVVSFQNGATAFAGTNIGNSSNKFANVNASSGNLENLAIQPRTNSTNTLQVANSAGQTVLGVDTYTNNLANLLTNPSFEQLTPGSATLPNGWVVKGATGTPSRVSSPVYDGSYSMQVTTTAAANAGASYSYTLQSNTNYSLAFYVRSATDWVSTAGASTIDIGYGSTATDTSCLTQSSATPPTITASGWTRVNCFFTTGTIGSSPYIYIKQTDAVARTFYVDAATLEPDGDASSKWQAGQISLNGVINTPVIIQGTNNSTNSLLVQNSSGVNIFGVDTTDSNLVSNHGMEVNTVGWAIDGTSTESMIRDTSVSYLGLASMKLTTTAHAQDGVHFSFNPTTLIQAGTTYTMSFYAKLSGATINTLTFGHTENNAKTSCVTTGSLTASWTRYTCSFTWTTVGTAPQLYITQGTTATIQTIWVDSVSLEPGSTATPYGAGSIYFNGVINSPVNFQNRSDSTTAFQIENAASLTLFSVNTAATTIQIGSSTAGTNQILLAVNNYTNGTTEPAELDGAMYYNSNFNQFRCGTKGAWETCGGLSIANTATATCTLATTTTACTTPNNFFTGAAPTVPANYCLPGRVIHVVFNGTYVGVTAASTVQWALHFGSATLSAPATNQASAIGTFAWKIEDWITCDSTTTVTSEGYAQMWTSASASTTVAFANSGTTTVTNTSAQAIVPFVLEGTTADFTNITIQQYILQGM